MPARPPTKRLVPFMVCLARPTITDVVQWKMDDSFDMHQFTSLCRNI